MSRIMHSLNCHPNPSKRLSTVLDIQEVFNFEQNRPPKNIDVLRFLVSRSSEQGKDRMSIREATNLAMAAIKEVWRSLGRGVEQDFVSGETFKKRIADVNWAYKHSNKNRSRIPDTDILAYLKKKNSDFDRFIRYANYSKVQHTFLTFL